MAILSVRMDDEVKNAFDAFCESVGLTPSAAVNLFVKMTLRENRIPFDIKGSSDPYWNKSNLAYLRKSVAEIEAGHYKAHDLIEDL